MESELSVRTKSDKTATKHKNIQDKKSLALEILVESRPTTREYKIRIQSTEIIQEANKQYNTERCNQRRKAKMTNPLTTRGIEVQDREN